MVGPIEYLLSGNQSKNELRFALFQLVVNRVLVKDSLIYSKQVTTLKVRNAVT